MQTFQEFFVPLRQYNDGMMKLKTWVCSYWQWLLTAVFAVAVFCFWLYGLPHLMLAREQMQMFLWNTDYLTERLAMPGGLSQYLGEFIVQFFLNPIYGACWYAGLFVAIQLLTWRLFKKTTPIINAFIYLLSFLPAICFCYLWMNMNIPMTLTVGFLLILMLLNLLLPFKMRGRLVGLFVLIPVGYWLMGNDCYWNSDKVGTREEMAYDMLIRQQQWIEISKKFQKEPSSSLAIQNTAGLALWKEQRITQQQFLSGLSLSTPSLKSVSSAFLTSEVAMQIGMVNIAQRSAFEAMEAIPNYNKSARALRRLVETNIVTGQYEVALKYISILEETMFYRGWARRMKLLAEHPEKINDHPVYHRLKEIYDKGEDMFFY